MTNKEDTDENPSCDSRFAAFLAVHMVKQILDDAYVIANSAAESAQYTGQPWCNQSIVENVKLCDTDGEDVLPKDESDVVNENKMELGANVVATSTPQKLAVELRKSKVQPTFIGQGDEEQELQNELSTSMFINHLFDMSEVETIIASDDNDTLQNIENEENNENIQNNDNIQINAESNELITEAMTKIMETYINAALGIALEHTTELVDSTVPVEKTLSDVNSEYSFLSDAFVDDAGKDIAFYINDTEDAIECAVPHIVPAVKITEINGENAEESIRKSEVTRFENAYLSLNRDDEQCSEDDENVILEDPKGMTLQEVELMTAETSTEDSSPERDVEESDETSETSEEKAKGLTATSAVSAASKKSLVNRCRSQGAKLLACLRGWWRRKVPGVRKEHQYRASGKISGMCPLSPDARRRAASLADQRLLRSPVPPRGDMWKFNTVNEGLVQSSHWKDYTFEVNPEECGEY